MQVCKLHTVGYRQTNKINRRRFAGLGHQVAPTELILNGRAGVTVRPF